MSDNDLEIYLTPEEVAQQLGMNERTIQNYVKNGVLKGYKVSHHTVRIKKSDLDKFMEERSNV